MTNLNINLPSAIYTVDETTDNVIMIRLDESGYHDASGINGLKHNAFDSAAEANRLFCNKPVTAELIEAYTIGSMFGWDLPHVQQALNAY